ncbi:MAG: tRNA pseudouridine(55) synthase TruB [Candidatus Omnitrophica bacterium]|nr:tRNA pseudouridine(55) synthase TruB [Candidatus Omnitrophota bacterium]
MDGVLIVDKPKGLTSHDIVDFIRKKFHIKKVGHAGTLDPGATGVLVLLLGNSTKMSKEFTDYDKEYRACLTLGVATDTQDGQGQIVEKREVTNLTLAQIEQAFGQFLGKIKQIPPMFSALKIKGKRLYVLAREGLEVERLPRQALIYRLKINKFSLPHIYFEVGCSKGTYIRTLCVDIAQKLGCVGYMSELCRIRSGSFTISQAVKLDKLKHFSGQQLRETLI